MIAKGRGRSTVPAPGYHFGEEVQSVFRNFFELKDELLTKGETFSESSLKLLAYSDLKRAAIGDAGQAACDLELVENERNIRLDDADTKLPEIPPCKEMAFDLSLRQQIRSLQAYPSWDSLSNPAKTYFLIRCLRGHTDNPIQRFQQLLEVLPEDSPYWAITQDLMKQSEGEFLSLKQVRAAYRGFEILTRGLSDWERGICLSLTLQGYSCTGGCFLP